MSQARTQTAPAAPSGVAALIPSQAWIIGAAGDTLLFLGTPVILIALFYLAERLWNLYALIAFSLVLAMGHYLPGLMRAYGDPVLFRRFPVRFVVAPVFFITIAQVLAQYTLEAFLLAVVAWGAWHWLMQTYGLVRIYDAKAKNFDAASARLDYALCIAWFGVLYWRTDGTTGVFMHFFKAGAPLSPIVLQWFARIWGVATAAITVFYLVHMIRRTRAGHPPSVLKLMLLGVSYLFYLYAYGYSSSKLIAYALFEGYHDIQYLAIVWIFNCNRAQKDPGAGTFTRFLFRQRAPLIVMYVLLCIGFGSFALFSHNMIEEGPLQRAALGLITGLAMVHFYFDGFIWRIREPETRATLDVAGDNAQKVRGLLLPMSLRHGLIWAGLGIPVVLLGVWEFSGGAADDATAYQTTLQVQPKSAKSHYMLGRTLEDAGRYEEALARIRRARELRPGYDLYDLRYAELLLASGNYTEADLDEIITCYENGMTTRPDLVNHANWAKALRLRGRLDDAAYRYQVALQQNPSNAETHFDLATVLMMQRNFNAAEQFCAQAVRLDPDYVDAHGLLGMIRMAQGRPGEGFEHYRQALRVDPDEPRILTSLALGLANVEDPALRDTDEAVRLADKARTLAAENPGVWENLAFVYAAVGRFEDAKSAAQEAARLYRATGREAQAAQLAERLAHFREEHP